MRTIKSNAIVCTYDILVNDNVFLTQGQWQVKIMKYFLAFSCTSNRYIF